MGDAFGRPLLDVDSIQALALRRGAVPDPGPYQPSPQGLPTVASPHARPTNRVGFAQVVHAMTADGGRHWSGPEWQDLARALLAAGAPWTAVADLTAATPDDDAAVVAVVARLRRQVETDLAGREGPPWWDVAAGLIARGWRLGVAGDAWDATVTLAAHWWHRDAEPPRDADRRPYAGVVAFNAASWLYELSAYQDLATDMTVLLCETERLLPPYSVSAAMCSAAVRRLP